MSEQTQFQPQSHKQCDSFTLGVVLVVLGAVFLLDHLAIIHARDYWQYWPAFIALAGVITVVRARRPSEVVEGLFQILVAFYLYASFEHLYGLNFRNSWPILVIGVGVSMVLKSLLDKPKA